MFLEDIISAVSLDNIDMQIKEGDIDFHDPFAKRPRKKRKKKKQVKKVIGQAGGFDGIFGDVEEPIYQEFKNDAEVDVQEEEFHDPFAKFSDDSLGVDLDDEDNLVFRDLPIEKPIPKVDVNMRLSGGKTLLILAVVVGSMPDVTKLVEAGIDINLKDFDEKTSIAYACIRGEIEIVDYLLEHNAKLEERDQNGFTALAHTVLSGNTELFKNLIEHKAKHDIRHKGMSMLMLAATKGYKEIIAELLNLGADPTIRDFRGKTAADYAEVSGRHQLASFLRKL